MRSRFIILALAVVVAIPSVLAQQPHEDDAGAIRKQFEIVRQELAAHGTITEYAPNLSGEIVSRRVALKQGRQPCEWLLAIDDVTVKRRVSAPLYRSTQMLPLTAIDPDSLKAHPIRERQWCCARSAEVEFSAIGGQQPFRTEAGDSWYISNRVWIGFDDVEAAARAASALAEAVRLCRRAGA